MDWIGMAIGFVIVFGITSLGLAWRARRRGHLLLDAGPLETPLLSGNPSDYIPMALALVGAWLWSRKVGPYPLVMMPLALVGILTVVVIQKKYARLRFTDQGILIKWSEITSYRWDRNPEGVEELELRVFRKGQDNLVSYPIPSIHRQRISEILVSQVRRES